MSPKGPGVRAQPGALSLSHNPQHHSSTVQAGATWLQSLLALPPAEVVPRQMHHSSAMIRLHVPQQCCSKPWTHTPHTLAPCDAATSWYHESFLADTEYSWEFRAPAVKYVHIKTNMFHYPLSLSNLNSKTKILTFPEDEHKRTHRGRTRFEHQLPTGNKPFPVPHRKQDKNIPSYH